MSHRGDMDTSTSAPQSLAPSPSRARTWRPLRSGARPVLTERDAARAVPRPESPAALDSTRATTLFARRLADIAVVDVSEEAPHHYKSTPLYHPEYGLGAAYEVFIHIDQKPVWKVRFPNAPGGAQDYEVRLPEMERCLMVFKTQLSNASKVNDPHQKK
jgi:hypothetical protein